jgi:hypothetical protein
MPNTLTDEQMITNLQSAGHSVEDRPILGEGATQNEKDIHQAMMNNWRTKLFLQWQSMQNIKPTNALRTKKQNDF